LVEFDETLEIFEREPLSKEQKRKEGLKKNSGKRNFSPGTKFCVEIKLISSEKSLRLP